MITLFLFLVALFAWAESKRDARLIREGRPIEHVKRWKHRLLMACWLCFALVMVFVPKEVGILNAWKTFALLLIAAGALFSACFRLLLNKKRGLHWAYIAPWSSAYDNLFYLFAGGTWLLPDLYAMEADWYKKNIAGTKTCVHRAGRLAYITELLLTLAALVAVSKL